jgi:hypothetical protein
MKKIVKRPVKRSTAGLLSRRQREQLEVEVISSEARLKLTRLLRAVVKPITESDDSHQFQLIKQNQIINLASSILGRKIYVLEMGDWDYAPAEYAWHQAELELVMRRPDTPQLIETLLDLIDAGALTVDSVNEILDADGVGVRFSETRNSATVEILEIPDLPPDDFDGGGHPNLRRLFERMDRAMQDSDWSLVLHTGASIFETLAKQVVPNPNIQHQSLGGWFALYRNHSKLAKPFLDVIEEIFKRRNIEPLAGHGSTQNPAITQDEAEQVRVLTSALVKLERSFLQSTISTALSSP